MRRKKYKENFIIVRNTLYKKERYFMQINTNINTNQNKNVTDSFINKNEQGNTSIADLFSGASNYKKDIAGVFSHNVMDKRNVKSDNYSGNAQSGDADSIIGNGINANKNGKSSKGDSIESKTRAINDAINAISQMITPEGYSQASELGITPSEEDPEKFVGVYERIQIELATYCEDYNPTFLNVNADKVKEVVGNIKVDFDSEMNFETLKNQIEKIMDSVGIEVNDENLLKVKEMLAADIPVTEDTIIDNVTSQYDEFVQNESIQNKSVQNESIQNESDNIEDAIEVLNNADDRAIFSIVKNDYRLNIQNLRRFSNPSKQSSEEIDDTNTRFVTAKNIVLEAAAVLSKGAFMHMQKLGININYAKISDMVSNIKEMENSISEAFLSEAIDTPSQEQVDIFKGTISTVYEIEKSHIKFVAQVEVTDTLAVVGEKAAEATSSISVESVTSKATGVNSATALESYEALGTKIRTDLGDSITKAFQNVDSLLEETGFEVNDTNRQAMRILGYNQMEINVENMDNVKEKLFTVDYIVKNLTPKTVTYLIANNINPLNKDLNTLSEEIAKINEELGDLGEKSYAKYLYKLEKTESISDEDRSKYISLFRALHEVSKKDSRAVGGIVNTNAEFTIENMLKVSSSYKVANKIDVLANTISGIIDPKATKALFESTATGSISLENALDIVRQNIDEDLEKQYMKEQTDKLTEGLSLVSDEQVAELLTHHIPVNVVNLVSTFKLMNGNKAFDDFDRDEKSEIRALFMDDADDTEEASDKDYFNELTESFNNLYQKNSITAMLDKSGMLKTLSEYAKRGSYYIPIEVGEDTVNIHLQVNNDAGNTRVDISIKESIFGEINLMLTKKEQGFDGMLAYENISAKDTMENLAKDFMNTLNASGIDMVAMFAVQCDKYNRVNNDASDKISNRVDRNLSFRCAKIFIRKFANAIA